MKTNKILFPLMALVIILGILSSCEKILEVDLPANQIGKDQVFADVQTANAALAGLYAGLRENSPISASSGALLGTYTDDLSCFALTDINGIYPIYNNQLLDTNTVVNTFWTNAYQRIYEANTIIEGVEKSQFSQAEKNRIKGEALVIRSLLFFYLQQLYGDIPYVDSTDYTVNQSLSKISEAEVLSRLTTDLVQSVALLTDDYRSAERVFVNRKVAQVMLAKIYLHQQRWADAEVVLKSVVQNPLYQFQDNFTKVFDKSSTHILWQLKPQNATDPTKEALLYYFASSAPSLYTISNPLLNIFALNDLRRQNWMTAVTFNGNTWYRVEKYKNRANNSTEYSVVFRLEEIYMLLAETLTRQEKIGEALPFVNRTRQRAGLVALIQPITKATLLEEISKEFRKEFFAEMGHRFLNLKRTGALDQLSAVKPNWQSYHAKWPVPQKELLLNPNLNPQNSGY